MVRISIKYTNLKHMNHIEIIYREKLETLMNLYLSLSKVPIASFNPQKIPYIGYTMKEYYKLYNDEDIQDTISFLIWISWIFRQYWRDYK